MGIIAQLLLAALNVVWWIIIISAVMSWLVAFNVVDLRNRLVYVIYDTLHRLTEPLLAPIRQFIPPVGGLDLSPLIALFVIYALRLVVYEYMLVPSYY